MNEVHDCELISRSKVDALEKQVADLKAELQAWKDIFSILWENMSE